MNILLRTSPPSIHSFVSLVMSFNCESNYHSDSQPDHQFNCQSQSDASSTVSLTLSLAIYPAISPTFNPTVSLTIQYDIQPYFSLFFYYHLMLQKSNSTAGFSFGFIEIRFSNRKHQFRPDQSPKSML